MADNKKTCFIIMPVSDHGDYDPGHFKRVYEHLIKPACMKAGFEPLRADDVQKSNIIVIDILHKIVHCDMALCDLSTKNPNVLYELGIRQAFDLPVVLIKDDTTPRIFDIQGFRDVGYNNSMRIDEVISAIEKIAEAITATYEQHDVKDNSIISLLSITKASIKEPISLSPEMSYIMEALKNLNDKITRLEPLPSSQSDAHNANKTNFGNTQIYDYSIKLDSFESDKLVFKLGDEIYHPKFNRGIIIDIGENKGGIKTEILFDEVGSKTLLTSFARFSNKPFKKSL